MKYYKGYKLINAERLVIQTQIYGFYVKDDLTELTIDGKLTIEKWYPSDGNSGPVPNNKKSIEASFGHDVLCDYINLGWLPQYLQPLADKLYYDIATKKGMWEWVVRLRLMAITWFMAGKGAKRYIRKIYEA